MSEASQDIVPIEEFPGYGVSRDGAVWSRRLRNGRGEGLVWRQLRPHLSRRVFIVGLYKERKAHVRGVGTLVLRAFVGPPPPGMECCHEDGDPTNNRLSNLRWGTHVDNEKDKQRHGTRVYGVKVHTAKLTPETVQDILGRLAAGEAQRRIATHYGVSQPLISAINTGIVWKDTLAVLKKESS